MDETDFSGVREMMMIVVQKWMVSYDVYIFKIKIGQIY